MQRIEFVLCDDCPSPRSCNTPDNCCDIVRWIDQSTRAQGLPFHVEDPETLRKIATLLGDLGPNSSSSNSNSKAKR